jgi:Histidine kinase-, DNA gyrase B-, and HSP90-like ATPase
VFHSAIERAGLRLTLDCPPLTQRVWVDRDMWEKIVLNVLSNAFKFTFEGGITVRLRQEGESAILEVDDTGSGIPEHEIPRLFDRFHRVEGARGRTHEGTGIGLALVQELAELHGGTVRATSVLGEGSIFTVTVPLRTAHLPPDRLQAARTLPTTALGAQPYLEEALRGLPGAAPAEIERDAPAEVSVASESEGERATVLLADDNADMRGYVRRLLAPRYEVRTAADGAAALAALREQRPDLLLSDVDAAARRVGPHP